MCYETVPQFNVNLITQFDERREYQGTRTIKKLSSKILEVTSDMLRLLRKKKKNMPDKSYTPTRSICTKVTPDIDFTNERAVHCEVASCKNYFL